MTRLLFVTFYEDVTRVIFNGKSLRVQFDYNFTEGSEAGLNWTDGDVLYPNDTRLMWYKMTMPKGHSSPLNYCTSCGHTDSQHTKELEIHKQTFPKGMKEPESNIRVSYTACNQCGCTDYIKHGSKFITPSTQQQRRPPPPQQQKIRRADGSWFYYSSSTYVMPVEDTGSSSDNTSNNSNDTTTEVDTVEGDYEF